MSYTNSVKTMGLLVCTFLLIISGCGSLKAKPERLTQNKMLVKFTNMPLADNAGDVILEIARNASLNELLAFGAANNPGLKGMFHQWQSAIENVTVAGSLPDPKFGYAYFLQEIETKVGPQQHKLSFSQTIPSLGKLNLKEEVAIREAAIKYREFEAYKVNLFHKLRVAYFKYYYLFRASQLVKENIERLEILEPVIRQAYEGGKAPYNNLIRIQIAIEKEKERRAAIEDSLANVKYKLNALLNREQNSTLPSPRIPEIELGALENDTLLLTNLRKYNSELAVFDGKIEQAEQALNLAQKQDAPDYMFGVDWVITANSGTQIEDDGKDPVMLMFAMNIPLYRDKYNAMENSAYEMLRATKKLKRDKENRLLAESRIAFNDIAASERRIVLFQKNLIEKAKQSFEVSRAAFTSGQGSFLDMIDTIQLIIEMQLVVEKEISNKAEKISELTKMFGNHIRLFKEE